MSSGLYSHTTRGIGTVLTAAIYNADHVNHITNHNPSMIGGYSDNVSQMQTMADPGDLGTESLSGSLADEIERLRFAIARIAGKTHWYEEPDTDLASLGGGNPLQLFFAENPLYIRRTENDTAEHEWMEVSAGNGVGNKYSRRLVGSGSNAVSQIRDYIAGSEILRYQSNQIITFIANQFRGLVEIGTGSPRLQLNPSGYMDFIAFATPSAPGSNNLRLFAMADSGVVRLATRDQNGTITVLRPVGNMVTDVRLSSQGSNSGAHTDVFAPGGCVMTGVNLDLDRIYYKPLQYQINGGSYFTVSG